MRVLSYFSILFFLIGASETAFALNDEEKEYFHDLIRQRCKSVENIFTKEEVSARGQVTLSFYVPVQDENKETIYINCERMGVPPMKFSNLSERDFAQVSVCLMQRQGQIADLTKFIEDGKKASEELGQTEAACKDSKVGIEKDSCGAEIACNVTRVMVNIATLGVSGMTSLAVSDQSKLDPNSSCLSLGKSDCLTELAVSIVKSFFVKISDLLSFLNKSGRAAVKVIKAGFSKAIVEVKSWFGKSEVERAEDSESNMLHLLSQVDPEVLEKSVQDPRAFYTKIWDRFVRLLEKKFEEHLTCGNKQGVEFFECRRSKVSWRCANCNRRLNSICSILGNLSGSFVAGILTGGATWVTDLGMASNATDLMELGLVKAGVFNSSPMIPTPVLNELELEYVRHLAKP